MRLLEGVIPSFNLTFISIYGILFHVSKGMEAVNTQMIKTRYLDNVEIIKKLKDSLDASDNKSLVLECIKKVEKEQKYLEQELLVKRLRTNAYKNVSKKNKEKLMKLRSKKEELIKEKKEQSRLLLESDTNKVEREIVYENDNLNVIVSKPEEKKEEKIIIVEPRVTKETPNVDAKEIAKIFGCDDEETEVLKRKRVSLKELQDAKLVYDGKFKLVYDSGRKVYERAVNEELLDTNLNDPKQPFNLNFDRLLRDFDREYGTNLHSKFMLSDMNIEYNFDKVSKFDKKYVRKVKTLAKKESKTFINVKVKDTRFRRFKTGLAAVAAAALLLTGGVSLYKMNNKNSRTEAQTYTTVSDAGATDAEEILVAADTTTKEVKNETKVEETKPEENKEDIVKETKKEEVKEENKEESESLKVGDSYTLDSTDLYYASTDEAPRGNTKYIEGNYSYKASLISVVYKNQVMQLVYNDSINLEELEKICKEKYGDDVKISINFDLVDEEGNVVTEHVGWVNSSYVLSKGKVLK